MTVDQPTEAIADAAERVRRMAEWEADVAALAAATETPRHYMVRDPLPSAEELAARICGDPACIHDIRYADNGDILFDYYPGGDW